jgi:thiopeptide-type bacteriocin biosynthesis protein
VFRAKYKLPEQFIIADGDNELLINCDQEIAILTFIDTLKNRSSIQIEEFLFSNKNPLIKNESGLAHSNECIAILLNEGQSTPNSSLDFVKKPKSVSYLPGSEWLYFKIYSGIKTADYLLSDFIFPFCNKLTENKIIDKWFFIRYSDPDQHIRIRFHFMDIQNISFVMTQFNEILNPLFIDQVISKIVIDSYIPEVERYHEDKIETTENLFHIDSVYTCKVLELLDSESGSQIRWQYAIRATDSYLDDLGIDLEQKVKICSRFSQNFFNEFNGNSNFQRELNEKYRKLRPTLEDLLNKKNDQKREMYPLIELLEQRSGDWKNIIKNLNLDNNSTQYEQLIFSYLHMMHNRIFMSNQRKNEFIIYDLLARHYKSIVARNKYSLKEV